MITIDDFIKIEIRIGTILEATKIPEGDRLLKLIFDFGPANSISHSEPIKGLRLVPGRDFAGQTRMGEIPDQVRNDKSTGANESLSHTPVYSPVPEAEKYPGREIRQVMSAIAVGFPDPSVLIGKQIAVITNLAPRKFKGYESQGMIMATGTPEEGIVFLSPEKKVEPGTRVK